MERNVRALALAGVFVLAACGGAPGPAEAPKTAGAAGSAAVVQADLAPEIARLIEAAKKNGENKLDLTWGQTTIGGAEAVDLYRDLFAKTYGFPIQVNFTPGPSMTDVAGKIAQEAAAGQKASTDIYLGSEGHFTALLENGALESYDYTKLSPRITPDILAPKNIGLEILSRFPGITYNSNAIKPEDAPKKMEDLLNPKWKGQIASEPNAASFDRVAFRPEWTPEKMKVFVGKLAQNIGGLIRCEELQRVASGEFNVFGLDCSSYEVRRQQAKGAPVAHAIPEDGALAVFFFVGVPRTAAHPNLAKLYINLMLSLEGQRILYKTNLADLHSLPGSQSASEIKDIEAKGIKLLTITPQFIIDHPENVQLRKELTKILTEKR